MNKISSHIYCRQLAHDNYYNLYLVHFFMPRHTRKDALSLIALHCELCTITKKAQDPAMAIIRLKWWYDNVSSIIASTNFSNSPVLECLEYTIKKNELKQTDFEIYFKSFEGFFSGSNADPDENLYLLLDRLITDKIQKNRFSRILQIHDKLPQNAPFRAFQLWLSYISHR